MGTFPQYLENIKLMERILFLNLISLNLWYQLLPYLNKNLIVDGVWYGTKNYVEVSSLICLYSWCSIKSNTTDSCMAIKDKLD